MKYFLLLLLLTGCVDQNLYNHTFTPQIDHGPPSYGYLNGVNWRCSEEEINEKLVWIECKFTNYSYSRVEKFCIQVGYDENKSKQEVLHSRRVCTSSLDPDENFVNYAAFIREKRNRLTEFCGVELAGCYMTTKEVLENP
jgi:hypothetical protein